MPVLDLTLHALFAALVLGAALLPRRPAAAAGAGLAAYALGAGAFAAVPGLVHVAALAARLEAVGLSQVFVGVNVGLMLLGAGTLLGAGLYTITASGPGAPAWAGALAGVAGGAVLAAMTPLLRIAGLAAAAAALAVLAASVVLVLAGRAAESLARRVPLPRWRRAAPAGRPPRPGHAGGPGPGERRPTIPVAIAAAATLVTLTAPHALAIIAGAIVAAVAAHVAARTGGHAPAVPVLPIAALPLVPLAWLLVTIAGPVGLRTAVLPMVPLSAAAQALLVPLLVAGAWGFFGVWPLHRWVPGPILAPVGGALLLRVGAPAFGAGFAHLQPVLFAAGVAAVWHAALTRRPAALCAGLGVVATTAIFTGAQVSPDARAAAAVLFPLAAAAAILPAVFARYPSAHPSTAFAAPRLLAASAALATYATLAAGLRAEVVLSVLLAAAAAIAAWRLRHAGGPQPQANSQ